MLSGYGTRVIFYLQDWHELRDGNLTRILKIPAHGFDVNWDPAHFLSVRFLRYRRDDRAEYLEFAFQVRWKTRLGEQLLWQEERTAVYRREMGQARYELDVRHSEATKEYLDEVFEYDHFALDAFLRLHQDRLLRMAAAGPDWQKAWLKTLLKDAAVGPTKSALLKALGPRD
jgi:hypothetical protein